MGRLSTLRKHGNFDNEGVIENEKRNNGYWVVMISSIPKQSYNDNFHCFYELLEQEWIDKLSKVNEGNKFGIMIPFLISNIEKHDWKLYTRPEKIAPLMHVHMMIPLYKYETNKPYRNYLRFYKRWFITLGLSNFEISGWHPSYPFYNLAYVIKDRCYREPRCKELMWNTSDVKKWCKEGLKKYKKYPLKYIIADDDYNNSEDNNDLAYYKINGFILFALNNIFFQQKLEWTLSGLKNDYWDFKSIGIFEKGDSEKNCFLREMDFFQYLQCLEPKYEYFLRTYHRQIMMVITDEKLMACHCDFFRNDS